MPNEAKQKPAKSGSPAKKPTPEQKREAAYQAACAAASWGKWTVFYRERADFYRNAQQQFLALGDYKDSAEQAAFCAAQAEEAETTGSDQALKEAMEKASSASSANDYYLAARELERLTDRPEAQAEADRCMAVYDRLCHRKRVRQLIVTAVICLLVIFGAGLVHFGVLQYGVASLCRQQEDYADALKWYLEAKDFGDSKERITECRYYRGIEFQEAGKYLQAYDKFRLIPGYLDADDRLLDSARGMMACLSPGDTITFGKLSKDEKAKWFVLDNDGESVTLLAGFRLEHCYDSASEAVTWKGCELRSWLNSDFLSDTFTENEQSLLLEASLRNDPNPVYGTEGGDDTLDRVYLLSETEVEQYAPVLFGQDEKGKALDPLKPEGLGWRLRTPGAAGSGTAFVDTDGQIILYGYVATAEQPGVRPVIRISTVG